MTIKPYLFVVNANRSQCGKDTFATLLNDALGSGCTNVKNVAVVKRTYEHWLDLPHGALDTTEYKNKKVVNPLTGAIEEFTYLDILIKSFHAWDDIYPGGMLTSGVVYRNVLKTQGHLVFTDIRKKWEVLMVAMLSDKYRVVVVNLISDRGEQLSTDISVNIYEELDNNNVKYRKFTCTNNKYTTLLKLRRQVETVVSCL